MPTGWTPSPVPYGADETIYLVIDRLGRGNERHDVNIESADPEAIIVDLMAGRFNDPVQVLAFNTLEHWSKDLSNEIANEIQIRSDADGLPVPDHLSEFIEKHGARAISAAL